MADLKRKQLRQFLSGSFNITGSLNVTGSVEFDKNISGSITSTASFGDLVVADNTFISNNLSVGTDVIGQKLQVDLKII